MKIEELKEQKRWLCATADKAPHKVKSSGMGGHNNLDEMETYDSAKFAADVFKLPYVGVCLGDGLAGVDFDHVRTPETGAVVPGVLKWIERLDTYTEISKSGTGFHLLMKVDSKRVGLRNRGDKPVTDWFNPVKDGTAAALAYSHPVLKEDGKMLDGARFYVFTGNVFEGHDEINERTSEFIALAGTYPSPEAEQKKPVVQTQQQPQSYGFRIVELTDDIRDKLKQNKVLNDLFNGNAEAHVKNHTDDSAVDWAFVGEGLKTFDYDGNIVYTLWNASDLLRDKCTRKYEGGTNDYMGYTIRRYIDEHPRAAKAAVRKNNEAVQNHSKPEPKKRSLSHRDGSPNNALECVEGGWLERSIEAKKKYSGMVTGFDELDKMIRHLRPGMYVFGAGSSMGKTTFVHQMADQLAENGHHVIYFTMEQEWTQLVCKSLSRIMYQEREKKKKKDSTNLVVSSDWAVPAVDIYDGKASPTPFSIERYKTFAGRVDFVEGSFETTVSDIQQYVTDFIQKNNGIKPVVFVDYLQIIPPEEDNHRTTAIETASRNVKALKNFQMKNDLVIFVISSLNRANYYIPLDFESFKNSGDIEYSADCVWGLELAVIQAKIFEDEGNKKGLKRKIAAEAKRGKVRYIRLVCLKNRFGQANFSVGFQYYPEFDTFECADLTDYYCKIAREYGSNVEEVDIEKEHNELIQKYMTKGKTTPYTSSKHRS